MQPSTSRNLLVPGTWHAYVQRRPELRLHRGRARKYVVIYRGGSLGGCCEERRRGLGPAIPGFLGKGTFRLKERYTHNNRLTVLERLSAAASTSEVIATTEA